MCVYYVCFPSLLLCSYTCVHCCAAVVVRVFTSSFLLSSLNTMSFTVHVYKTSRRSAHFSVKTSQRCRQAEVNVCVRAMGAQMMKDPSEMRAHSNVPGVSTICDNCGRVFCVDAEITNRTYGELKMRCERCSAQPRPLARVIACMLTPQVRRQGGGR